MRKLAVLFAVIVAAALAGAAPALAQDDPFEPSISEDPATPAPDDGTGSTGPAPPEDDVTAPSDDAAAPEPPPTDDPLPSTGADPARWLGLAALALTLGVGLLVVGRLLDPNPPRRSRG